MEILANVEKIFKVSRNFDGEICQGVRKPLVLQKSAQQWGNVGRGRKFRLKEVKSFIQGVSKER